jgi:hypothetical protein
VIQNPDGTYTRDFTHAGTETPFLSFADIDYGRVPGDVLNQLIGGFTKEFFSNNPTPNTPNVLSNLLNALLGGGLGGILGGVSPLAAQQTPAALTAASVPASNSKLVSLSAPASAESEDVAKTGTEKTSNEKTGADETSTAATDSSKATEEPAAAEKPATAEAAADESTTPPKHAKPDEESQPAAEESTGPKHAKPDEDAKPAADTTAEKTPKHDKPSLNVVRDSLNASAQSETKSGEKTATAEGKKDEATAADGASESNAASSGAAA